jgi:hypothetical protein
MDLGTAPLFDLTAPVADEAEQPAVRTRSQELLAGITATVDTTPSTSNKTSPGPTTASNHVSFVKPRRRG